MKLKATPLQVLENALRERVAKHSSEEESTTMLAIRGPLAARFRDEAFARQVSRHPLRHQLYVRVLVHLSGPCQGGASPQATPGASSEPTLD